MQMVFWLFYAIQRCPKLRWEKMSDNKASKLTSPSDMRQIVTGRLRCFSRLVMAVANPSLGSVLHAHKLLHQFLVARQFSLSYRLNQLPGSSPPQRICVCQRVEIVPYI